MPPGDIAHGRPSEKSSRACLSNPQPRHSPYLIIAVGHEVAPHPPAEGVRQEDGAERGAQRHGKERRPQQRRLPGNSIKWSKQGIKANGPMGKRTPCTLLLHLWPCRTACTVAMGHQANTFPLHNE
jgi:hypothetical protein